MTPRRAPLHHVTGTNYHSLDLPRNPGCVIHKCIKGLKDEKLQMLVVVVKVVILGLLRISSEILV